MSKVEDLLEVDQLNNQYLQNRIWMEVKVLSIVKRVRVVVFFEQRRQVQSFVFNYIRLQIKFIIKIYSSRNNGFH